MIIFIIIIIIIIISGKAEALPTSPDASTGNSLEHAALDATFGKAFRFLHLQCVSCLYKALFWSNKIIYIIIYPQKNLFSPKCVSASVLSDNNDSSMM